MDEEWYPFFWGLNPPNNSSGGQDKHHWDDGENCCATVTIHWKLTPKNSEKIRRNYLWNWYPQKKTWYVTLGLTSDGHAIWIDLDILRSLKNWVIAVYVTMGFTKVYHDAWWFSQLRCAITPSSFFFSQLRTTDIHALIFFSLCHVWFLSTTSSKDQIFFG